MLRSPRLPPFTTPGKPSSPVGSRPRTISIASKRGLSLSSILSNASLRPKKPKPSAKPAKRPRREAEAKAREARAGDIESQREAARAQAEAEATQKAAAKAGKDQVKGLRTVTKFEITSHRDLLAWLYKNRPDDIAAFLEEWARRNHRETQQADGLRVWTEKTAY